MANGHGGARRGAGRRRKAIKYAGQIAAAEDRIADKLPGLIDNMLVLADGVRVEETNIVTGQPEVYQKPPDRAANIYLIDRILGRPGVESDDEHPTTDDDRPTTEELLALWTTDETTTDESSPSSSGA